MVVPDMTAPTELAIYLLTYAYQISSVILCGRVRFGDEHQAATKRNKIEEPNPQERVCMLARV